MQLLSLCISINPEVSRPRALILELIVMVFLIPTESISFNKNSRAKEDKPLLRVAWIWMLFDYHLMINARHITFNRRWVCDALDIEVKEIEANGITQVLIVNGEIKYLFDSTMREAKHLGPVVIDAHFIQLFLLLPRVSKFHYSSTL